MPAKMLFPARMERVKFFPKKSQSHPFVYKLFHAIRFECIYLVYCLQEKRVQESCVVRGRLGITTTTTGSCCRLVDSDEGQDNTDVMNNIRLCWKLNSPLNQLLVCVVDPKKSKCTSTK